MKSKYYFLSNGIKIPCIGFGTWQITNSEVVFDAVTSALKTGYRHIDTAAIYRNEESIGDAIAASGISRTDVFVTSKVWNKCRGYDMTMQAFERTLSKLKLEYLDLYLIHWPANELQYENWNELNLDTWRALAHLYKNGVVKCIGVSNFKPHHLKSLLDTEIVPMVNQIEYHPGHNNDETVNFCRQNNIRIEAWSPLGSGRVLENELLVRMAEKYNKSTAQICIRWCLQNGVLPLPKSVNKNRIVDNLNVFDFDISDDDMKLIDGMNPCGFSGFDPDNVDF